jgi:hypothetical protein
MSAATRVGLMTIVTASLLLATGCSAKEEPKAATPDPAPVASSGEDADADPLAGEWRTSFTCEESVKAVVRRVGSKWQGWMPDMPDGRPTKKDPCRGSHEDAELLARFSGGVMALCQQTGVCEVHATYEYPDASTVRIDDPEGNLCEPGNTCPVDWTFEISGDQLAFRVDPDAWTIGAWEAAPWTRVG